MAVLLHFPAPIGGDPRHCDPNSPSALQGTFLHCSRASPALLILRSCVLLLIAQNKKCFSVRVSSVWLLSWGSSPCSQTQHKNWSYDRVRSTGGGSVGRALLHPLGFSPAPLPALPGAQPPKAFPFSSFLPGYTVIKAAILFFWQTLKEHCLKEFDYV